MNKKLEEAKRVVMRNGLRFIKESERYRGKHPKFNHQDFQTYLNEMTSMDDEEDDYLDIDTDDEYGDLEFNHSHRPVYPYDDKLEDEYFDDLEYDEEIFAHEDDPVDYTSYDEEYPEGTPGAIDTDEDYPDDDFERCDVCNALTHYQDLDDNHCCPECAKNMAVESAKAVLRKNGIKFIKECGAGCHCDEDGCRCNYDAIDSDYVDIENDDVLDNIPYNACHVCMGTGSIKDETGELICCPHCDGTGETDEADKAVEDEIDTEYTNNEFDDYFADEI